ncbi:protein NRT1/ PTR FAMILY 2.11-like isoform X1 [Rhodamnia argentea]|uniref:Protein NRT1/ PTR FAMILY 2.11-like isoform X1 n=1 Tax=Rhodamnia argentea TaxID=178133 RepID=A0ABM3HR31_9MYRT|nr:protein NRT1/ PTR FAMILY 2.11-like isoform X1 [Rhodamnia argentea]XP_048139056.1 protein NRT1/ PTR FAMILY 2.11-like isoform X1 [Rhodamnia argentea]
MDKAMEKEEDGVSAREIRYGGIKAMPFVIGNETFEKLGTIGTSSNLLVYLTTVFNMKSITATNIVNIFNGTINFATLLGAFLCDTYFGRYKTLGFASVSSFLGMLVLTLTAAIATMHPPHCETEASSSCRGPTFGQMAFLLSGFGLLVIGGGGIRPCNLAFGADQFNPNTESGKRGISSFFNWYYFTFTFAMMVSLTIIVYVQADVSWAWGLAIPTFLMFLSCAAFFVGTRIYVKVKPAGSPLASASRVIVAAIKKRKLKLPDQPCLSLYDYVVSSSINSKLPHTEQFRFLDKAAIITPEDQINRDGSAANPRRLCSIQQVEEVKCLIRVIPIWISAMIYYITLVQQQTYVVFQALQSDRRLGSLNFKIPAATYIIFSMIALTIWIPIYDRMIIPRLRKLTGKEGGITLLQKMGIGMFLAVVTMLISAIVENKRRTLGLTEPIGVDPRRGAISSMSGLWLVPQLVMGGLSEAFTIIAQVEFYYKQFPENMRSIGGSLSFVGIAMSSYLCSLLISIVHQVTKGGGANGDWLPEDLNKGKLDYFYYLVGVLQALNLGYFIVCARWYKYKGSGISTSVEVDPEKLNSEKVLV